MFVPTPDPSREPGGEKMEHLKFISEQVFLVIIPKKQGKMKEIQS